MKEQLECKKLLVKKSPIHGYGVFAEQDIQPGEIIEECYARAITQRTADFNNFYFGKKDSTVLPFGYGCIYNHSVTPNADYEYDHSTSIMSYVALSAIKPGEEIFISYGKGYFTSRNMKLKPISIKDTLRKLVLPLTRFAFVVCAVYATIALLNLIHMPT